MKIYLSFLIFLPIVLFSCNQGKRKSFLPINELEEVVNWDSLLPIKELEEIVNRDSLKNNISIQLKECLPDNWEIWEEYSEEYKIHLNHIGRGEFDLHFKAKYHTEDTLFPENTNGKSGDTYYPELILAFYKNKKSIKESVKFTRDHSQMISDTHPMYDVAETRDYLIYGGYNEDQKFQPQDAKLKGLRECIKGKSLIDK
jgi:hypothetical protein